MPTREEGERCIRLRRFSKEGRDLTTAERAFCGRIFNTYPEWYEASEARVFNETVPFGSNAHREEPDWIRQYAEEVRRG
jgi:hypothetical protein